MKRMTALLGAAALTLFTVAVVAGTASAATVTEDAGSAGTVTFSTDGGVLAFVDASPAAGWEFTVTTDDGTNLKVVFTDTTGAQTEFEVQLSNGQTQVATSEQPGSTASSPTTAGGQSSSTTAGGSTSTTAGGSTSTTAGGSTSTTAGGSTTSTTIDDDDDDDTTSTTIDDDDDDDTTSTTIDDDNDDSDDDHHSDGDEVRGRINDFQGTAVLDAGPAGTVSIEGDGETISLLSVDAAAGWGYSVKRSDSDHIKIGFLSPDGLEVEFKAELKGSHLDWKYEIETADDDS